MCLRNRLQSPIVFSVSMIYLRRVFVLNVEHLFVDLFHGHPASEDGGDGEVAAVSRIAGSHHVLKTKY